MTSDSELQSWTATWREAPDRPVLTAAEVRARVRRRTVGRALRLAFELALGALWIALAVAAVRRFPDPAVWLLAGSVWILTLGLVAFSVANSIGTWFPSSATVHAHVALAAERARRDLRAARVGLAVGAVYTPFVLAWALLNRGRFALEPVVPVLSLVPPAVPLLVLGFFALWVRRARRELARWEEIRGELEEPA